jgi:uncharacterized damage-inducible protein DinB
MSLEGFSTEELVQEATDIRRCSLESFAQISKTDDQWRVSQDRLSFKDMLFHIVDCDYWLFENLDGKKARPGLIQPRQADNESWDKLIGLLGETGRERNERILKCSDSGMLSETLKVEYFNEVSVLGLFKIVIEHETHHLERLDECIKDRYGE